MRTPPFRTSLHLVFVTALMWLPALASGQPASRLGPQVRPFVDVSEPVVALTGVRLVDGTGAEDAWWWVGDPASDVSQIWNVELVFKDGVGYDSEALFDSVEETVGIR